MTFEDATPEEMERYREHIENLRNAAEALSRVADIHEEAAEKFDTSDEAAVWADTQIEDMPEEYHDAMGEVM